MLELAASLAHSAEAELAECPVWDERRHCLWWVDIPVGNIHRFYPENANDAVFHVGGHVGSFALCEDGSLVLATPDGFSLWDESMPTPVRLAEVEADNPATRMNDGACDPAGRFWAGTMAYDNTPGMGSVYRLDPDGTVDHIIGGVTISNGIGWSPDGETMYYVDTPTRQLDAFDFDIEAGVPIGRRTLVTFEETDGMPDGIDVDASGNVWVALWGGWQVRRYSPKGELTGRVSVPVEKVSSCSLGGPEMRDLYITTAQAGPEETPALGEKEAGGIFRVTVDVPGLPTRRFARLVSQPAS